MAYLSRFVGGGFVAGAKLYASQLNGELDNLIDALVGTDNKNIKLKYNAGDNPTLEVWNSGGNVIEFHVGAGDDLKLHVDSSGTLISAVTTGTAPITVASTTVATNLNADFIDGKHLTSLVQSDIAVNTITAAAAEVSLELEATGQGADAGKAVIYFDMRDTANNVDAWWRLVGHGDDTFRLQQYDQGTTTWIQAMQIDINGATPYFKVWDEALGTLQHVATTKSRTMAQIGAFYEGVIATAAKQATFIASDDSEGLVFTKAKYVFRGGTLVGNTVIEVRKYSNATPPVLNQTVTLTLPNTDTIGNVYTVDTTDMNVAAGESIQWVVTTADLHEDLSVWMIGEQEIKTD
jgi:hypothetical protein